MWQAVLGRAYPHLLDWRDSPFDDACCAAWRRAMLAAGATERDLDVMAVFLVLLVIMRTKHDSPDRQDLIECIALHVAGTSMMIRIGGGVANYVAVEFPDRPSRS